MSGDYPSETDGVTSKRTLPNVPAAFLMNLERLWSFGKRCLHFGRGRPKGTVRVDVATFRLISPGKNGIQKLATVVFSGFLVRL